MWSYKLSLQLVSVCNLLFVGMLCVHTSQNFAQTSLLHTHCLIWVIDYANLTFFGVVRSLYKIFNILWIASKKAIELDPSCFCINPLMVTFLTWRIENRLSCCECYLCKLTIIMISGKPSRCTILMMMMKIGAYPSQGFKLKTIV
jgi:hypothetical protein